MSLVYNIFYTLSKLLAKIFFNRRIVHPERMIEEGPLILAVNHSSYFDPPLAGTCSKRAVYYLARKSLMDWPILGPLFPQMNVIPVRARRQRHVRPPRRDQKRSAKATASSSFPKAPARRTAISSLPARDWG